MRTAQSILFAAALVLLLVAAARPRWGRSPRTQHAARDIVIAVDVSKSMLAADVTPTRLAHVRESLHALVDALRGDRVALVAFRARAVTLCPRTTDHAFLRDSIRSLSPDNAPPGPTDIAHALTTARALNPSAILLVTDGEHLSTSPLPTANYPLPTDPPILVYAAGTVTGAPIPDPAGGHVTRNGNTVLSRLNPDLLNRLATATVRAGPADRPALVSMLNDHTSRHDHAGPGPARPTERYQYFLLPALCLLVIVMLLSHGRPAAVMTLLLLLATSATAGDKRDQALRFNAAVTHYHAGEFAAAATLLRPLSLPDAPHTLGCALFRQAAAITPDSAQSALQRVELLEEAGANFRNILTTTPSAPHNLALTITALTAARETYNALLSSSPRGSARERADSTTEPGGTPTPPASPPPSGQPTSPFPPASAGGRGTDSWTQQLTDEQLQTILQKATKQETTNRQHPPPTQIPLPTLEQDW